MHRDTACSCQKSTVSRTPGKTSLLLENAQTCTALLTPGVAMSSNAVKYDKEFNCRSP